MYSPMRTILVPARRGNFALEYETIPPGVTLLSWPAIREMHLHTFKETYHFVRTVETEPDGERHPDGSQHQPALLRRGQGTSPDRREAPPYQLLDGQGRM